MAEKTVKAPNYSDEQTALLRTEYLAAKAAGLVGDAMKQAIAKIAVAVGKTDRSVIAKLTKEGVYEAKAYVSKTGEKPVKKDIHADAIGLIAGLSEAETESLTKANKTALVKIMAVFKRANDAVTAAAADMVQAE